MTVWNAAAARWLFFDGLLPLLGAGALFLLWGGIRYVTSGNKGTFNYSWKEALDPMAWLYGAAILSAQAGSTSAASGNSSILTALCVGAGIVSLLLLLSAMTYRGEDANWEPPRSLEVVAALLIAAILIAGYKAHGVALSGVALTGSGK